MDKKLMEGIRDLMPKPPIDQGRNPVLRKKPGMAFLSFGQDEHGKPCLYKTTFVDGVVWTFEKAKPDQ